MTFEDVAVCITKERASLLPAQRVVMLQGYGHVTFPGAVPFQTSLDCLAATRRRGGFSLPRDALSRSGQRADFTAYTSKLVRHAQLAEIVGYAVTVPPSLGGWQGKAQSLISKDQLAKEGTGLRARLNDVKQYLFFFLSML